MNAMIESLECRQMFSVAMHAAPHPVKTPAPAAHVAVVHQPAIQKIAVHSAVNIMPALMFAGTAIDSKNEGSEVLVTVTQSGAGFTASVRVVDADGTTNSFIMTAGANGAFTYTGPVGNGTATVQAQLSADRNSMTGNFTSLDNDGTTSTGAISVSRTLAPAKFFVGRGKDATGQGGMLMVVVTPTVTGYVAQVRCVNPDGSIGGVIMTGDASGHFLYNGPDQDDMPLQINAQLSADGQSVAGSFISTNSDGSSQSGAFNLART